MINLKQKLKSNQRTIGSWITIPNPITTEIMCQYFDWLVIDMEHSAIDIQQCQDLIRLIESHDTVPLVRIPENNPTIIKRVLDAGAYGIIVPMVNNVLDAHNAINSAFYPPKGRRGVGLARAQGYGFGFDIYQKWLNKNVVIIAQIEHINAMTHLQSIFMTDIDAAIIGPYDISASMGYPGAFCRTDFKQSLKKILDVAEHFKKTVGIHVIPPYIKELKDLDDRYKFIAFSLDTLFFGSKIRDEVNAIKNI